MQWDQIIGVKPKFGGFRAEIAVSDGSERSRVVSFHGAGCKKNRAPSARATTRCTRHEHASEATLYIIFVYWSMKYSKLGSPGQPLSAIFSFR